MKDSTKWGLLAVLSLLAALGLYVIAFSLTPWAIYGWGSFVLGGAIIGLILFRMGNEVTQEECSLEAAQVSPQREQATVRELAVVGRNLTSLREKRGLSIEEAAARSGVASVLIERFEEGTAEAYFGDTMHLARTYNVSLDEISEGA